MGLGGMEMMVMQMLKSSGVDVQGLVQQGAETMQLVRGFDQKMNQLLELAKQSAAREQFIQQRLDDIHDLVSTSHDRTGIAPAGQDGLFAEHGEPVNIFGETLGQVGFRITEANRAATAADYEPREIEVSA